MAGGWGVLVNYPDGTTAVRTVFDTPVLGRELLRREGWVVTSATVREEEFDGQPITFEVSVKRYDEP